MGSKLVRLLVIDNYDSFTFNLVQMFKCFALHIDVHRSDRISIEDAASLKPDYILISPGPKDPSNSGISVPLIKAFHKDIPILGVCLGMQCINEAFGGSTIKAPTPMHGKTSMIYHKNKWLLKDIPSPFTAARYHSLIVQFDKTVLEVTSYSPDGIIMGLSHPIYPLHGVQFHPESFLTEHGCLLIKNFLRLGRLII